MLDPINMLDLLNYVTVANTDFSGIPDPRTSKCNPAGYLLLVEG